MSIIITGSLAYDHILQFPGHFEEHILPENLTNLSISFLVDNMKKMRGGCASNIAYSLSMLGKKPTIMATAGEDFCDFDVWLKSRGVDTSLIDIVEGDFTACCFITTDRKNNQITGFYAGAMAKAHRLSFKNLKFKNVDYKGIEMAIISPNDPEAMKKYCNECRELGIPFIFDPGHNIPRLSGEELLECMKGSVYTVINNYELTMIMKRTGKNEQELLELTETIIATSGAQGSIIKTKGKTIEIKSAKPTRISDPTGSGDAYRAGLIAGHLEGLPIDEIGKLASVVAVYVVEQDAPAQHNFTLEQLKQRYLENYGGNFPLKV